jgi:hypothetical protein
VQLRTTRTSATGAGLGSSNNSIRADLYRNAQGAGGATASDNAVGLVVRKRTATDNGTSSFAISSVRTVLCVATATGNGSESADKLVTHPSQATGSGSGTSVTVKQRFIYRLGDSSGSGASTSAPLRTSFRNASGNGLATQIVEGFKFIRIFTTTGQVLAEGSRAVVATGQNNGKVTASGVSGNLTAVGSTMLVELEKINV